jgi:hypothetical protein
MLYNVFIFDRVVNNIPLTWNGILPYNNSNFKLALYVLQTTFTNKLSCTIFIAKEVKSITRNANFCVLLFFMLFFSIIISISKKKGVF